MTLFLVAVTIISAPVWASLIKCDKSSDIDEQFFFETGEMMERN
jgi:hypothetical protein